MAQDHELCKKKGKAVKWTGARAATAGPCCSCQRNSLAACKHVGTEDKLLALKPILAHMAMNRGKRSKVNGGKQT